MQVLITVFTLLVSCNGYHGFKMHRSLLRQYSHNLFNMNNNVVHDILTVQKNSIVTRIINAKDISTKTTDNILILCDISVREYTDIEEAQLSFAPKLLSKMKSQKQELSKDKFFYVHDVGDTEVCSAAIGTKSRSTLSHNSNAVLTNIHTNHNPARIPLQMYEKLDLSRKIAESLNSDSILVVMLGQFGEVILDKDMCDGIIGTNVATLFS